MHRLAACSTPSVANDSDRTVLTCRSSPATCSTNLWTLLAFNPTFDNCWRARALPRRSARLPCGWFFMPHQPMGRAMDSRLCSSEHHDQNEAALCFHAYSTTWLAFFMCKMRGSLSIATASASRARCCDRPGRKPYEKGPAPMERRFFRSFDPSDRLQGVGDVTSRVSVGVIASLLLA